MNKNKKILPNNLLMIALHVGAWIIIMLIPSFIINTYGDGNTSFLMHLYSNIFVYGLLFYINYIWLVPKLFFKNKKTAYFLIALAVMAAACVTIWYLHEYLLFDEEKAKIIAQVFNEINKEKVILKPPIKQFNIVNNIYTSLLIVGFSLGLKLLEKVYRDEKERKELEKEKLNSELALLKNQISPHFFFNTLNNIYSLIGLDTEDAQNAVLKLSKLMRYLLYESDKGESKLSEEVTFLNNYIDLMKLRLSKKVELSVEMPREYKDHAIPSLLFIPLVENAFKHGVSYRGPSFIHLKMEVDDKRVIFKSENSIGSTNHEMEKEYSGIGLENLKKRLNLLYPGRHSLNISDSNNRFEVELILEMA